jgi:hypothetical protein
MRLLRLSLVLIAVLFPSNTLLAQHGTASSGYFPMGYSGDTWSGTVTAINPATREITLLYNGKKGDETFTGVLEKGYQRRGKDGKSFEVQMSEIPVGSYMVAYYMQKTKKVEGKKEKYNEIIDFELSATAPNK